MDFEQIANDMVDLWHAMVSEDQQRDAEILSSEAEIQEPAAPEEVDVAPVSEAEEPPESPPEQDVSEDSSDPVPDDEPITPDNMADNPPDESLEVSDSPQEKSEELPPEEAADVEPESNLDIDDAEQMQDAELTADIPEVTDSPVAPQETPEEIAESDVAPDEYEYNPNDEYLRSQQDSRVHEDSLTNEWNGYSREPELSIDAPDSTASDVGHSRQKIKLVSVEARLPDGWEADLSQTIQTQMRQTQSVVQGFMTSEMERSSYENELMGGYD